MINTSLVYQSVADNVTKYFGDKSDVSCVYHNYVITYPLDFAICFDDRVLSLEFRLVVDNGRQQVILVERQSRIPNKTFSTRDDAADSLVSGIANMLIKYADVYYEKRFKFSEFTDNVLGSLMERLKNLNELGFSSVSKWDCWTKCGEAFIRVELDGKPLVFDVVITRNLDFTLDIKTTCVSSPLAHPTVTKKTLTFDNLDNYFSAIDKFVESANECIGSESTICRLMGESYYH